MKRTQNGRKFGCPHNGTNRRLFHILFAHHLCLLYSFKKKTKWTAANCYSEPTIDPTTTTTTTTASSCWKFNSLLHLSGQTGIGSTSVLWIRDKSMKKKLRELKKHHLFVSFWFLPLIQQDFYTCILAVFAISKTEKPNYQKNLFFVLVEKYLIKHLTVF